MRQEPLRGLLLAGGTGSRLRPLTYTGAKQLLPVANKPILFYVVEAMVAAGVREIAVVVGDTRAEVEAALGDGRRFGATLTYVPQARPLGLADAVRTAQPVLGDAPFLMVLGDNLLRGGYGSLVERFRAGPWAAAILVSPVDRPQAFGVAVLDPAGRVVRLVEKPRDPPSRLALVGAYCFDPLVHTVIADLQPSPRGEYEITDAIQGLVDRGLPVDAAVVEGWWKDTGRPEDILEANRLVLEDRTEFRLEGTVSADSQVTGRVALGPGSRVVDSVLRGPAVLGADVVVEHAYIGPYTALGDGCVLRNSEIEHSVVLPGCRIEDVPARIDQSLLGRDVVLTGRPHRPRAVRLVLGDRSQAEL
ncbi:Glucose-1-phosphate thymidylyltransferase [Candidatus Hydrogenisulfobacillus filiaventi]|uniref:Glucose-1-phosphate thymidylyltransferase n=1 Tax=Candidatus Hydrogenisulfobacillus filiaventi TaxID=2707344 RepID=A0A6F8ZDM6_9FIRM|nr:Glucose-1-phosphate thymidylyltransferase [Candidatus Hydrogenisulfobacillus filiaventi]